jgi:hypothetical protein
VFAELFGGEIRVDVEAVFGKAWHRRPRKGAAEFTGKPDRLGRIAVDTRSRALGRALYCWLGSPFGLHRSGRQAG